MARHIIVMGVCGCGKSTIAAQLAEALKLPFAEADVFHPPANIKKMENGVALNDEDRWPWLASLRDWMSAQTRAGIGSIVTCSALKRSYRDVLREAEGDVVFVLLHGSRELLAERISSRKGHFMPLSLLDSQLDTLELPQADEPVLTFNIAHPPEQLHQEILHTLSQE